MKRLFIAFGLLWLVAAVTVAGTATAAGAVPRSFFGVVTQGWLSAGDFAVMGDANVGTLRILVLWDDRLQPSSDACCDWTEYDALIGQAAANGVEVLPFVFGLPTWARDKEGQQVPTTKGAVAAWQQFLKAFVYRYGRSGDFWMTNPFGGAKPIKTIQIWNEPSSPCCWSSGHPDGRQYAKLVIRSHRAVSEADPKQKLMLAGLLAAPSRSRGRPPIDEYLHDFFKLRGVEKAFDVAAIHPYAATVSALRQRMELMREAMDRAGDKRTPIQVSELGWSSAGPPGPFGESPRGQAKKLRSSFSLLKRERSKWHVNGINWFSWQDVGRDADVCVFCHSSGLFEEDGTAKPSWAAFQTFSR